ncbi:MAG: trigger factor [Planctomycetota bacterium]
MEVSVENTSPSLAKVSFSVPAEEFEKEVQAGLRQVGRNVRMKGFRPGKVPASVVAKLHGEQIRREVAESFLRKAYSQAVEQEHLKPITHPSVSPGDLQPAEDGSFSLELEVSLKPTIELPEYKGMGVESELEPVLDEQVEQVIEDLRRQDSLPQPVGDEGIDEDGLVLCDVTFAHGENTVFERKGVRLTVSAPPPGVEAEAFRELLLGAKEGSQLEIEMVLPPDVEAEEARGEKGLCRLTVRQAFRMVPPTDEELFKKLEVLDHDAMLAKVRLRMVETHARREQNRIETFLIDKLIRETELELPGPLLDEQAAGRLQQFEQQLLEQDTPPDEIQKQLEEHRPLAREEAEKGLRALLIVEALGEKEELLVTAEELDAELGTIAERNDAPIEEVRKYYVENNLNQQMAIEVLERKVRTFLRENAEIITPS